MSCRTFCKTLALITVLIAVAIVATPAFGQTCIQDEYNAFNNVNKKLSCTANDVRVAKVDSNSVNVFSGGIPGTNQCIAGGKFSFTATFDVVTSSTSTRSNIGIFFGTGQNNAISGTCSQAILSPQHSCTGNPSVQCGDANYKEYDTPINGEPGTGSPIGCGDTSSTDSSSFGPSSHAATLEVDNVTCPATNTSPCPAGSGFTGTCLALPTCTGWYQPTNTMPQCESPAPSYPWQPQAVPGTTSKCECGFVYVPVTPVTITPIVQKACEPPGSADTPTFDNGLGTNPPSTPTQSPTTCDAGAEGGTVTFYVNISNTSTLSGNNLVVDQICDDQYGTIYSDFSPATCPAGKTGITPTNVNCPPSAIAPGGSGQCKFTATVGENVSIKNTVSVWGHSSLSSNSTFSNIQSNQVTVTSSDAPTTAKTNKGLEPGPQAACVTLRFDATVTNTSGADESVTINSVTSPSYVPALNDSYFGDITATHGAFPTPGAVTGTTCGVLTTDPGLGTLSGSKGSGAFPKTLSAGTGSPPTGGGSYTCMFDGVICGTPGLIVTTPGVCTNGTCSAGKVGLSCTGDTQCNETCSEGIQNLDTVTANLTGDEPSAPLDTITQTTNQFTANVCFVQSGH